jgi:hypothetical protein
VIVGGHSQGAPLAALCAAFLAASLPKRRVALYALGGPRVGDAALARAVREDLMPGRAYRVVNTEDVLTEFVLPVQPNLREESGYIYYSSCGEVVAFTSGCTRLEECHSLSTYARGLSQLRTEEEERGERGMRRRGRAIQRTGRPPPEDVVLEVEDADTVGCAEPFFDPKSSVYVVRIIVVRAMKDAPVFVRAFAVHELRAGVLPHPWCATHAQRSRRRVGRNGKRTEVFRRATCPFTFFASVVRSPSRPLHWIRRSESRPGLRGGRQKRRLRHPCRAARAEAS